MTDGNVFDSADISAENTLAQIIEDLKWYAQMNLTVERIELGYSAWVDVQMRNTQMWVKYDLSPGGYPTLLGIPITVRETVNTWARSYQLVNQQGEKLTEAGK